MRATVCSCVFVLALACGNGNTADNGSTGPGQVPLHLATSGEGVIRGAGSDCRGACTVQMAKGSQVQLQAVPDSGATFAGWSGGCTGTASCQLTLNAETSVVATFTRTAPPPGAHLTVAVTGPGHVGGGGLDCGNGATTCDLAISPAGSAVTLTASAAPNARFLGWGGACSGTSTTCSVTVTGDTRATAAFDFELQTLFADDGTVNAVALVINSTDVFFSRTLPMEGSSIWAVPKTGGAARRVTTTPGVVGVADDAFLYFITESSVGGSTISSVPVDGGTSSRIFPATQQFVGDLRLDDGALYFVLTPNVGKPGSVHRMQDRVDQVIATDPLANGGIAVDSDFAYFTFGGPSRDTDHGIKRVDKLGRGTASTLITTSQVAHRVRVDSQNLYYRDDDGIVFAVAKDGSGNRMVSGNPGRSFLIDLDVNAFQVFWLWIDATSSGAHGLFRANADGSGFTALDTAADNNWIGLRVDDTAAFYWHNRSLMKRLK